MAQEYKTMEFRVGIFLITVLVAILAIIVYVGIQNDLFADKVTYYVSSNTGENIERGIPVRVSGFKIGNVQKVYLDNVGNIKVELEILERYQKWIRKDSKIILDQEGIIGNSYFKLIPGSDTSPMLKEDAIIKLSKVAGLNELIQDAEPVIKNLKEIVANIRDITNSFLDKKGQVQSILTNTEQISERILRNKGMLYYLTEDPRPVDQLNSILARTDHAVQSIDRLVQNSTARINDLQPIQEELVNILKEGQTFITSLDSIRAELSPTLANAAQISENVKNATTDLVQLRRQGEYTIRLGTELLQRLKETWPFARGKMEQNITYPAP
ncbi:MAG: MlaD family protein [Desulfoplanes sp.]|nr:MlaD family protein [Desulfoplanes sp.]